MNSLVASKKNIFLCCKETIDAKHLGSSIIIPHVCNNLDLFGAGFANAIANEYPQVKNNYHMLGKKFLQEHPGYVQFIDVEYEKQYNRRLVIANMISQNGIKSFKNPRPLNYAYLVKSMVEVKKFIVTNFNKDNPAEIHCPKFGTGLAGGNWFFISELINDIWKDIKVVVYSYENKKQ